MRKFQRYFFLLLRKTHNSFIILQLQNSITQLIPFTIATFPISERHFRIDWISDNPSFAWVPNYWLNCNTNLIYCWHRLKELYLSFIYASNWRCKLPWNVYFYCCAGISKKGSRDITLLRKQKPTNVTLMGSCFLSNTSCRAGKISSATGEILPVKSVKYKATKIVYKMIVLHLTWLSFCNLFSGMFAVNCLLLFTP